MKRLNIRLLVILILGTLFAAVGTHFLHGYQLSRMADNFLARADSAKEEGNIAEEIKLLKRYMLYRPKDVPTLKRLLLSVKNKVFAGSIEEADVQDLRLLFDGLNRAVQNHPEDIDLRREAVDFALRPNVMRIQDAKDNLAALEKLGELKPDDKVKWAHCHAFENENDKAIDLLGEMIGFDRTTETIDASKASAPNELRAYALLSSLYRLRMKQSDDFAVSDLIMNRMLEANQDKWEACLMRAEHFRQTRKGKQRIEEGFPDVQKALELAPDEAGVIIAAADSNMGLNNYAAARELLERGLAKHPDDSRMYTISSRLSEMQGDKQKALHYIVQGLDRLQQNKMLMWHRAQLELDLGKVADAKQTYERLNGKISPPYADYLLARLEMAEGKYVPACQRLEKVRTALKSDTAIEDLVNSLRICYDKLGKTDLLRDLDKSNANSPDAKLRLAQDLKRRGKFKEALDLYEELSKVKELTKDGKNIILFNLYDTHFDLQNSRPEKDRKWDQVDKLAKIVVGTLGFQGADLESFEIDGLVRKGLTADAKQRVERAVDRYPQEIRFWLQLDQLTKDNEQGLKILDRMRVNAGDTPQGRIALAARLAQANPPDIVEKLESFRHGMEGFKEQERQYVLSGLAAQFTRLKKYERAVGILNELQTQLPDNPVIANKIFETAIESGDENLMDESLARIANLATKGSTEYRIAEVKKRLWQVKNDKLGKELLGDLLGTLNNLASERPDWADVHQLKGDAFIQQGKIQDAVSSYQVAIEKSPGDPRPVRALVEVLIETGHVAEAQPFLRMLPADSRTRQEIQAEISYIAGRDPEAALKRTLELISPESQNAADLIFLSRIQQAAKKPQESLASSRRATEVDPQNTQAWLRYTSLLASSKQTDAVDAVLREIEAKVDEKQMPLLMGQCSTILGRSDEAKRWYQQAFVANPSDTIVIRNIIQLAIHTNDVAMSNEYLDKLVQIKSADRIAKMDIAWGKREKAKLLAASQTSSDFRKAIALIEENKEVNGELLGDDLSVWLLLHSNRPEPESRAKAIAKLETLDREHPLSSSARVIQAKLYTLANRWPEARSIMVAVLAEEPNNESVIAQYVDWLLERNELAEASTWAQKLSTNSSEGLRLTSILLVRQQKSKEAAAQLLALIPEDLPKERSGVIREVARMCALLGQYDPLFYNLANKQWRRYLALDRSAMPGYLEFLFGIPGEKRLEEALNTGEKLVQRAIKEEKWDQVIAYAKIAISGLRIHQDEIASDSKYYEIVQNWLSAAEKVNESSVVWEQAALAELRDDFVTVEKKYRQFLTLADRNDIEKAIVRNNLAYRLAVSNKGEEAIKVIDQAISVLGVRSDLRDTRAVAYISAGRFQDAINDLQSVIDAGEGTAQIHFHLAWALHKNGIADQATEQLRKSLDQGLDQNSMSKEERSILQTLLKEFGMSIPGS